MTKPESFMDFRLMRRGEVERTTGYSTRGLYDAMRAGAFPRPLKIGRNSVAWISTEVEAWISERVAERDQKATENPLKNSQKNHAPCIEKIPQGTRLLRLQDVVKRTGKSVPSIYADMNRNLFPTPVSISTNRVAWLETEVNEWIQERLTERNREYQGSESL